MTWPPRRGLEQPRTLSITADPPVPLAEVRALPKAQVKVSRRSRKNCVGYVFTWEGPKDGVVTVQPDLFAAALGFPDAWKMVKLAEDPETGEVFYRRLEAEWRPRP